MTESGIVAGSPDGPGGLPAPLGALLAAAAARCVSTSDALAEAVVAYALATLGTRDTHALLGVGLTWKSTDGLYGLTADRRWRKLTELSRCGTQADVPVGWLRHP